MKALVMILNALMLMTLSLAHADRETVEIPDSGLRNVIAKHLKKPADATITDITEGRYGEVDLPPRGTPKDYRPDRSGVRSQPHKPRPKRKPNNQPLPLGYVGPILNPWTLAETRYRIPTLTPHLRVGPTSQSYTSMGLESQTCPHLPD